MTQLAVTTHVSSRPAIYDCLMFYACNKKWKTELVAVFSWAALLNHPDQEGYVDELTLLGHFGGWGAESRQGINIFNHLKWMLPINKAPNSSHLTVRFISIFGLVPCKWCARNPSLPSAQAVSIHHAVQGFNLPTHLLPLFSPPSRTLPLEKVMKK